MEDWTSCHIFSVRVGISGVLSNLWLRDLFACTDNLMLLGKNVYSPISGKWLLEVAASCWPWPCQPQVAREKYIWPNQLASICCQMESVAKRLLHQKHPCDCFSYLETATVAWKMKICLQTLANYSLCGSQKSAKKIWNGESSTLK